MSGKPQPPATLAEVARRAGVSPATASRALNSSGYVHARARKAVELAANELNYVGHGPARALASRRTKLIGAIVPTLDNPIFARCLDALQAQLDHAGLNVLLATSGYDMDRELVGIRTLLERGVDGLMLVGWTRAESTYRMIASKRVPICQTWSSAVDATHSFVGFDNKDAIMRVVAYLHDIGHRRFAMVAGRTHNNDRAADRLDGFRTALDQRGLTGVVRERSYAVSSGREAMRELMSVPCPPTAIVCGNDLLALGVLTECASLGLRVPRDLSVTGFDDLDIAACSNPPLTTIHVAAEEIGHIAAELLIRRIGGENAPGGQILDANLIVRGSTAPPKRF